MSLSIGVAFLAGLLSFFAPCVFALVPAFIAYLAGINISELSHKEGKRSTFNRTVFLNTLAYVVGFVTVFTVIGLLLHSTASLMGHGSRLWLTRVGGLIIIIFGLSMLGLFRIPWLDREYRFQVRRKASYTTSFLFGTAFAVGWTPCIGAVLGSILTLAVAQPGAATGLLLAYSLGLALPFLLIGVFSSAAVQFVSISRKYTQAVSAVLGLLLIIIGLLLFFDKLSLFGSIALFEKYL
jgi:cytochrome c-type biogenesis protein